METFKMTKLQYQDQFLGTEAMCATVTAIFINSIRYLVQDFDTKTVGINRGL